MLCVCMMDSGYKLSEHERMRGREGKRRKIYLVVLGRGECDLFAELSISDRLNFLEVCSMRPTLHNEWFRSHFCDQYDALFLGTEAYVQKKSSSQIHVIRKLHDFSSRFSLLDRMNTI